MTVGIIVKNYQHFNRALDKQITSRAHYEREMAKGGFVSFEKGEQMVAKNRTEQQKYNGLSPEKMKFLHQVKDMADKKGNIRISDRFVEGLKKHKVINPKIDLSKLPKHYQGGFENA
jgi:hypothetical protein